jgi:hypothetical protein
MDPKRPSGPHFSRRTTVLVDECESRIAALEDLAVTLKRRVDVIDGNGNPMAEGGFIGRMKREHDQNQRLLKWILGFIVTANIALLGNLIARLIK